jgi:hypothetical protein
MRLACGWPPCLPLQRSCSHLAHGKQAASQAQSGRLAWPGLAGLCIWRPQQRPGCASRLSTLRAGMIAASPLSLQFVIFTFHLVIAAFFLTPSEHQAEAAYLTCWTGLPPYHALSHTRALCLPACLPALYLQGSPGQPAWRLHPARHPQALHLNDHCTPGKPPTGHCFLEPLDAACAQRYAHRIA